MEWHISFAPELGLRLVLRSSSHGGNLGEGGSGLAKKICYRTYLDLIIIAIRCLVRNVGPYVATLIAVVIAEED